MKLASAGQYANNLHLAKTANHTNTPSLSVLQAVCLTAHQRIYLQMEWTVPAFVFPAKTGPHSSFTDLGGMEGPGHAVMP